jgi:glycosyltransferase involved in cell wall biosynthesis
MVAPQRILFLIRSLGHGGAERQLVTLARGLSEQGFGVTIATFYPGGPLERELGGSAVTLQHLAKRGRWDVAGFIRRLAAFARKVDPHIIHGYMPTSNLLATAVRVVVPRTRLVWGVRASGLDRSQYDWLARREFDASRMLARRADLIIANSYQGARWHREQGYPERRLVVIPNGIDVQRFRPDEAARRRRRAAWGIPESAFLVGLVGRLDPMKDHPTFLRAAARLAATVPEARFVCVGEGPTSYADELRALGESLGLGARLRWEPPGVDVHESYAALDVLASTSAFGEGFSNVIGEAMACGIPCAVSDCADAARIVGDTGLVVPVGDPAATAAAWDRLRATDRPVLGGAARARIVSEFSVELLVARTADALRPLLGSGSAA